MVFTILAAWIDSRGEIGQKLTVDDAADEPPAKRLCVDASGDRFEP